MTRLPRLCPVDVPVHVVHRGHDRKICFVCDDDYLCYLSLLSEGSLFYGVEIHSWVLMTNHIHILVTPKVEHSVSRLMQHVGSHYVRYFNRMYGRTGTLWEGRFKSCLVEKENYFLVCQRYIELNPVRAKIVEDPGGYRWSSYRTNALGKVSNMIVPHEIYASLGFTSEERVSSYRKLFSEFLGSEVLDDLRKATQSGLAFGSDSFKDQIEATFERRVRPEKPGRKTEH